MTPRAPLDVEASVERGLRAIEQRTGWERGQALIAVAAGLVIVLVCCVSGSFAVLSAEPAPTSTRTPAPTLALYTASDLLARFTAAGLPITKREPLKGWSANEAFRVELGSGTDRATFLLLSYASAAAAGADAYLTARNPNYAQWTLTQVSNILLLVSPESAASLRERPATLLAQVVTLPVRPFLTPP